jgi:hypothetical protein
MFIKFSENKANYRKGQLTPIFIVVIAVLIIMAMVTVNINKVAMTKTYGANGADAGALAGGSIMANLFNAIAQYNSYLESEYWMFFASYTVSFIFANLKLTMANTKAELALTKGTIAATAGHPCPPILPADAAFAAATASAAEFTAFNKTIAALNLAVLGFWLAQLFMYKSIRKLAEEQHRTAKGYSYTFAFANSGISAKLKSGSAPSSITEPNRTLKQNNYQESFSTFLDTIKTAAEDNTPPDSYTYEWLDGEERRHFVTVQVIIDEVDTFDLQLCLLPYPAEQADLLALLGLGLSAKSDMSAAAMEYASSSSLHGSQCETCPEGSCNPAPGNAAAAGANITVIAVQGLVPYMYALLAVSEAGLAPARQEDSTDDSATDIIAWINDVVHDRLVELTTIQSHQGGSDIKLWQAQYPDIRSYSIVNFNGNGSIYPPELRHDADIVETDKVGHY